MDPLFDIAWKALATGGAVVLVAKVGERSGALVASVVMTFPMNAGPGFFFVALEQSAAFVSEGALVGFAGTAAVLGFVAAYVRIASRRGFALGLAAAALAWLAFGLLTAALPRSLVTGVGLITLGAVVVAALGTTRTRALPTTTVRATWYFLLARGVIAGLVVATVARFADVLGPTGAGLAYAFPTMMIASMWVLERNYGPEFTLATMARVPAGLATYAGFCLTLYAAAGPLPPLSAWGLAAMAAIAIATLRALTGRSVTAIAARPLPPRPPWRRPPQPQ